MWTIFSSKSISTVGCLARGFQLKYERTKVYIADERIWSDRIQETTVATVHNVSKEDLWKSMNIDLIGLQDNYLDIKKFSDFVQNISIGNFEKLTFFIIHQGLIDKLDDNCLDEFNLCLKKLLDLGIYLILTSGRGALKDSDMDNARFLEFATLESILNNGDKLSLVKVLFSLRYRVKENE